MPPYITSLVRTLVPMIVGWLIALPGVPALLDLFGVDTERADQVVGQLVAFGLAFAYYALVRWLEKRWPQLGVLLGIPVAPVYPGPYNPDGGNKPIVNPYKGDL